MTSFQFILASLACYRLTVLIARDAGPFELLKKLRNKKPHWLGCPYCVSMTIAILIEAAFYLSGVRDSPVIIGCIVLSMSAIAIACDRVFTSDHVT